jgi:hypothetical protein
MPIAAISAWLRLPVKAIRIAVGLRLGTCICQAHRYSSGSALDPLGTRAFWYKQNPGRIQRRQNLNDLVWRAPSDAGVGLTSIPWHEGRSATWDAQVIPILFPRLTYHRRSQDFLCGVHRATSERPFLLFSLLPRDSKQLHRSKCWCSRIFSHFSSPTVTSTLSVAVHFVSWGCTLSAGGALGSWGCTCTPCTPWLRLCCHSSTPQRF